MRQSGDEKRQLARSKGSGEFPHDTESYNKNSCLRALMGKISSLARFPLSDPRHADAEFPAAVSNPHPQHQERIMMKQLSPRPGQAGFTLIELLIVVAIIGILAAIAVPQYQTYTKKAKFTEVVNATSSLKTAVEGCLLAGNAVGACESGENGVPVNSDASYGAVSSIQVATDGTNVITATASASLDGATFTLTPVKTAGGAVTWTKGGTCLTTGLCN
jgi:type IV pilus assembly protein PilA